MRCCAKLAGVSTAPCRALLSDDDRAEWAGFARRVRPLPGRATPAMVEPPPRPLLRGSELRPVKPPQLPAQPLAVGTAPGGLDRSSWNRLRSGRTVPGRTLDLHGRTAQAAFTSLHAFLRAAHTDQVRCVEVITGRGSGEAGGVIRRELPIWLNQPALRTLVLAASYPPSNPGAVRVLLRRTR